MREEILGLLLLHRGQTFSGAQLGRRFGVSRAAVWKAVEGLRDQGWPIEGAAGGGYRLPQDCDGLSAFVVKSFLGEGSMWTPVVFSSVDSTNNQAKLLAAGGAPEGTVIIADEQTGGRGRMGRSFYSPAGTGLYMSLLLRPTISAPELNLITIMSALALCRALEDFCDPRIKWPNDIFYGGKKICGILTEGALEAETGGVQHAVLGVGLNVAPPAGGFPGEIEGSAGFVFDKPPEISRNELAARILSSIERHYRDGWYMKNRTELINSYKERLVMLGQRVRVLQKGEGYEALAVDVDSEARLVVENDEGERIALSYGEISIRPAAVI